MGCSLMRWLSRLVRILILLTLSAMWFMINRLYHGARGLKLCERRIISPNLERKRARFLTALLDKYADSGIENIESMEVLKVQPLNQFGTPLEIISLFGGKEKYLAALRGLETQIYMAEA